MVDPRTLAPKIPQHRWSRFAPWAAAAFCLAALFWLMRPPAALGLRAEPVTEGQVRIAWQRSRPVLAARSALLEIRDGEGMRVIPLSADQLRNSSLTYLQETSNVTVRMQVTPKSGGAPVQEIISVLAPPAHPPVRESRIAPLQASLFEANSPIVTPADLAPIPIIEPLPKLSGDADRAVQQHAVEQHPAPVRPLQLPAATQPVVAAVTPLPAPPVVNAALGTPPPALNLPAARPAISMQRSGRIIWTGSLDRRGVVEIEGTRATVGSLVGELPGLKVAYRVSPAEFVAGGLVVYTSDRAASHRTEPASKANGWNATRFEYDPQRARQLVVLEAPNASNEFKRLALRSDARNCSVIVVDWSVP